MPSAPIFTPQAFDLLAAIARTPTAAFYLSNKTAFKELVEAPLQGLMRRAALQLPGMFRVKMETERNLFSRFLKNDFGRGGAWTNYWGAFYPKGSRRVADVQLSVWVNATRVGVSFYIGDYGTGPRERFRRNCARCLPVLPDLLCPLVENPRILLPGGGRTRLDEDGYLVAENPLTWEDWLADPAGRITGPSPPTARWMCWPCPATRWKNRLPACTPTTSPWLCWRWRMIHCR